MMDWVKKRTQLEILVMLARDYMWKMSYRRLLIYLDFLYTIWQICIWKRLFSKEPIPCFTNILGLFISILLYASLFFESVSIGYSKRNLKSQTRVNEHLQIVTTSLQWPLFVAPFWMDPEWRPPTFDGHYFGVSRVVTLYTGLTVLHKYKKCFKTNVPWVELTFLKIIVLSTK